jgi:hypothetical protein
MRGQLGMGGPGGALELVGQIKALAQGDRASDDKSRTWTADTIISTAKTLELEHDTE